jgi:8-oxo-dGTP diphosphatase
MTEVVAALIRAEGNILICQRPGHKARGLLWEFPGGKVEPGETPQEALQRECMEELNIGLTVGKLFARVTHQYPELLVRLSLYEASIAEGSPQNLEHRDIRWASPGELKDFDFCPADKDIIAKLSKDMDG